jgi:hypothetical protein
MAETNPTVDLYAKLREVAEAIPFIEKRGQNGHHKYNFAQAVDVVRDVRKQLLERKIIVVPGTVPGSIRHLTETGGKGFVTTVDLTYQFVDTQTGVSVTVPWTGAGADVGGDKGLYKAYTGGLKYALLSLFLLPTTDDPEHDALTVSAAGGGVDKDADRPAAPTIPLDRAKSIVDQAVAAGLATPPTSEGEAYTFSAVLRAKLADLGADKIGALNVDQAEEIESFIKAEVES